MDKKWIWILMVLFFLVLFSVILAPIIIFIILPKFSVADENGKVNKVFRLQVVEDDVTSFGFIHANLNLKKDEYISYSNKESGHYSFITQFGGTDHQCSGSCYCSKSERRYAAVLKRGMLVLLSAFSTTVAYRMAQESFQNECEEQFSGDCESENIVADVEDCAVFSKSNTKKPSKTTKPYETGIYKDESFEILTCVGTCTPNDLAQTPESRKELENFEAKHPCSKHKYVGQIKIYRDGFLNLPPSSRKNPFQSAKFTFMTYHLHPWCKSMSRRRFSPNNRKDFRFVPWCVGYNSKQQSDERVREVKCERDMLSTIDEEKIPDEYFQVAKRKSEME